jgi:hypothetical protein
MYKAGKHSMATDAYARTGNERAAQEFLGHKDSRSTRRYARLGNQALVEVLRVDPGGNLDKNTVKNSKEIRTVVVSPAGFEPARLPRRCGKYLGFSEAQKREPQESPRICRLTSAEHP